MVHYKKENLIGNRTIRKDRSFSMASGPRDIQRKLKQRQLQTFQANDGLISELRSQISKLESELLNSKKAAVVEKVVVSGYTDEEFDSELVKAVEKELIVFNDKIKAKDSELKELNNKLTSVSVEVVELKKELEGYKSKNSELEKSVAVLEVKLEAAGSKISDKDSVIEDLRSRPITVVGGDEVVIDPDRPVMDMVVIDPNELSELEGLESNIDIEDVTITEKEGMNSKIDKLKALLGGLG